jgi:ZIP family zinc transporter
MSLELIFLGSVASLVAGLATGAGALPVLFAKKVSDRLLDIMLGFSAGVMLAATSFSLIIPAIDLGGPWIVVLGIV